MFCRLGHVLHSLVFICRSSHAEVLVDSVDEVVLMTPDRNFGNAPPIMTAKVWSPISSLGISNSR